MPRPHPVLDMPWLRQRVFRASAVGGGSDHGLFGVGVLGRASIPTFWHPNLAGGARHQAQSSATGCLALIPAGSTCAAARAGEAAEGEPVSGHRQRYTPIAASSVCQRSAFPLSGNSNRVTYQAESGASPRTSRRCIHQPISGGNHQSLAAIVSIAICTCVSGLNPAARPMRSPTRLAHRARPAAGTRTGRGLRRAQAASEAGEREPEKLAAFLLVIILVAGTLARPGSSLVPGAWSCLNAKTSAPLGVYEPCAGS
jgi:hypothetical protein